MINKKLLAQAVNQITQHPETFSQDVWYHSDCGTKHTLAGWVRILGNNYSGDVVKNERDLTGLSRTQENWLFCLTRHLSEIHAFVSSLIDETEFFNQDGYDIEGYDRTGYNRNGFDRERYNRQGFNMFGRDKHGYNKYGFDCHGLDREGYNVYGFDKDGYSREGYDQSGYDRDGYDRNGYNEQGLNREGEKLSLL